MFLRVTFINFVSVWEARFHPRHPNYLFTCSQDGSLWQWNLSSSKVSSDSSMTTRDNTFEQNDWLVSAGKLDVSNILSSSTNMSVNSFDIQSSHMLAVTDQEALYVIPNLIM